MMKLKLNYFQNSDNKVIIYLGFNLLLNKYDPVYKVHLSIKTTFRTVPWVVFIHSFYCSSMKVLTPMLYTVII